MAEVLTSIAGSTYNATGGQVTRTAIVMVILLAIVPLCRRWLTILPSLGGDMPRARWVWRHAVVRIAPLALAAMPDGQPATMTIAAGVSLTDGGAAYCARMPVFAGRCRIWSSRRWQGRLPVFTPTGAADGAISVSDPGGPFSLYYWRAVLLSICYVKQSR